MYMYIEWFEYQVLARLDDDRVLYPAYNYLYGSTERRAYKQLAMGSIRRDTGIIAPRLVSMESILSRLNFNVLPLTIFLYLLMQLHGGLI